MANKHALLSPCLNMYYVACASTVGFSISNVLKDIRPYHTQAVLVNIWKVNLIKGFKNGFESDLYGGFVMRFKQLFYGRICLLKLSYF